MLSRRFGSRAALVLALVVGMAVLPVGARPARADVIIPKPKPQPQPRPPRPQPPLPKPPPPPEPDKGPTLMVGLTTSLAIGLMGLRLARRYQRSRPGTRLAGAAPA